MEDATTWIAVILAAGAWCVLVWAMWTAPRDPEK